MRNFSLTLVLALFTGSLFAHPGHSQKKKSDLNVKMWNNSVFSISLDHHPYQKTRNFSLRNINPGTHFVKIIKRSPKHYGHGGFVKTLYKGYIHIPARRKVFVKVEGKHQLSYQFFKKSNHHSHGQQYGCNDHYDEWEADCGSSQDGNDGFYDQSNFYGPVAMDEGSFKALLQVINNEPFDDNKLNIAKQVLTNNYINVKQVSSIMDQLTFDDSKLEFSKLAYGKTVDKENYFIISSKFTFSSSANELHQYISSYT